MGKLLYRPLGLLFGVLGGLIASAVFDRMWGLFSSRDEAPEATSADATWSEVLLSAALQGAVFAFVKAFVDRSGASGFRKLTGVWPGGER